MVDKSTKYFDMSLKFGLAGAVLEPNEAMMLLATVDPSLGSSDIIPLDALIDVTRLNAQDLFDLSVKQKNQALASLAWKVSISKESAPVSMRRNAAPEIIAHKKKKVTKYETPIDTLLEQLNTNSSYAFTGAAMLLKALKDSEGDSITLRQAAVDVANQMWATYGPEIKVRNSKFFKGFEYTDGLLKPVVMSSGIDRKHTFHVSPMYIALREGLLYAQSHGLVDKVKLMSVGAPYVDNPSTSKNSTRRMYYKIKLTERGKKLISMWGDLENYVQKVFQEQKAS